MSGAYAHPKAHGKKIIQDVPYAQSFLFVCMHPKKIFLSLVIASLSAAALAGIVIFLLGRFGETEVKILLTTLFLGLYSLTALCCATLYEKQKAIPVALVGMLVSAGALIVVLMTIWTTKYLFDNDNEIKMALSLGVAAFSFGHAALLLLPSIDHRIVAILRYFTLGLIAVVACMLIFLIVYADGADNELFLRLLGVFAILDALGTIVTPIAMRMVQAPK